ncbi:MAG: hypothetical protein IJG97_06985 [Bacilli bacterium]|nr:hypothetical protein [Bacilli bacterium]
MSTHAEDTNKKRILVFILFCLVFVFLFQEAYAKYRKYASVQVDNTVAKWNIKINNELIGNKTTLTNHIIPTVVNNNYVKNDVLAPGSLGYFDVDIDATDADVSFTYEINVAKYDIYTIEDLTIYAYSVDDFSTSTNVTNNIITGTIQHNTASTKVRIYYKWLDDGTDVMNNQTDTTAAITGTSNADILATFHLTQVQN